jgi:hypothetical protein
MKQRRFTWPRYVAQMEDRKNTARIKKTNKRYPKLEDNTKMKFKHGTWENYIENILRKDKMGHERYYKKA